MLLLPCSLSAVRGGDVQSLAARLTKSTLVGDFSLLMFSQVAAQLAAALAGLVVVRALVPAEYGRYALALTTIGLAGTVVDFGLNAILSREIARQPRDAPAMLSDALAARLGLSLAAVGLVVGVGALWSGVGEPSLLLLAGLALAPRGLLRALSAVWLGLGQGWRAALLDGLSGLLLPLSAALAAWWVGRAGTVLLATSLATIIMAALVLWSSGLRFPWPDSRRLRALLGAGAPLMLAGLAGAAFHALDLYVVSGLLGQEAVASYAAPFRVLTLAMLPPTVWGVAALPRFAALRHDRAALRRALWVWLPPAALAGLLICLGVSLAAPYLTALLLGPSYAGSVPVLALLIWMAFFVYLSAPYIALLTALDRQIEVAGAVLLAGLVAVVLNLWLAPRLGLLGVAAVKVGAMGFLLALYAVLGRFALRGQSLASLWTGARTRSIWNLWSEGWRAIWRLLFLLSLVVLTWARRWTLRVEPFASLDDPFGAYGPKLWVGGLAMLATLLAYLLAGAPGWRNLARRETRLLAASGLALAAWGWLSLTWAAYPALGLLPAAWLSLAVLVMLALLADPPEGGAVALAFAVAVAVQAAVALPQFMLQRDLGLVKLGELPLRPEWPGVSVLSAGGVRWLRAFGLSIHPNLLGGFAAVGGLFALAGFVGAKGVRRVGWGGLFLAGMAACLASFSRGAWLAGAVGTLLTVGVWLLAHHLTRARLASLAVLALAALVLLAAFTLAYRPLVMQRLGFALQADPLELRSMSDRAAYEDFAGRLVREHFPLGTGLANMVVGVEGMLVDDWRALDPQPVHRVPSLVLVELGLPGLLLWGLALIGACWTFVKRWPPGLVQSAALGAMAVMLLVGLFDHYPWTLPPTVLLWWILLALPGALEQKEEA